MRKVATIGSFDGVHRGHRCLLEQVRGIADRQGLKTMAVTFALPPKSVLGGNDMVQLNSMEERIALLNQAGMEEVAVLNFTHEMAAMTARDFMQQVLKAQLDVAVLVIGYDHRFGRGRTDGFDDYVRYGRELDIEVVRGEACIEDGEAVSSTRIRRCIAEGDVTGAAHLLGYNYRLCGTVVGGYRVGRKIGFPTANISNSDNKLLPADGVYAVRVNMQWTMDNGKMTNAPKMEENNCQLSTVNCPFRGMLNIGHRPTVNNGEERSIEVHILDFEGDLYGQSLCVEFVEHLRNEQTFESLEALMAQLEADKERVRQLKIEN
ncbi:MAG: bifunctional riboflavin kinase/FAD synthetase [Bacteroidaceae bacterium]|nr:bifunctional riboflavin kinase/FAD synthetase [Bacteroidaceae bacterium]